MDHRGYECDPGDPYAVQWSISGAVQAIRHNELVAVSTIETIAIALADRGHEGSLIRWETADGRTARHVQDLLIDAERFVRKAQHPHPPKDLLR